MKFMKLGSKADAFQSQGNCTRYVQSELATDMIITVGEVEFHLHKFPLLSKSNKLQKLLSKASEENADEIHMTDFPGGPRAFEICAKFCYGMIVTLSPYNVVAARCASEYLEMTEDIERGNLTFKIEVFLNSSIFCSWKDSIIVLQTTKSLLPWSEDLKVVERCIGSISSKTSVDPSLITWSYTCNRKTVGAKSITEDGIKFPEKTEYARKGWWIEDICELEIDLFQRVMVAVKSKGRMDNKVIGEALKTYVMRWLPDSVDALVSEVHLRRNKSLVETIICLLPSNQAAGCSCSFLLKLLKDAILFGVDDRSVEDLIQTISLKLDEANVDDLLIPARSPQATIYDIELVKCLVTRFFTHEKQGEDGTAVDIGCKRYGELVLGRASWLNVGKLVDNYLAKTAHDSNLTVLEFIQLSQLIPETARPVHDRLYRAIDIYLKEHPTMSKPEKKNLCSLMDVKKFTAGASMHAAQNERLPVRIVVQVLFFEQVRSTPAVQLMTKSSHDESLDSNKTAEEGWDKMELETHRSLGKHLSRLKLKDDHHLKDGKLAKKGSKNRSSGVQLLLPSRSRRIFDKLWIVGKGNAENRSSETSGSSQSPTSLFRPDMKTSAPTTRERRNSIS